MKMYITPSQKEFLEYVDKNIGKKPYQPDGYYVELVKLVLRKRFYLKGNQSYLNELRYDFLREYLYNKNHVK